ncbi:peptidoglycan editing factor PgeF [Haliea sp.]|uniref:peptidoglycan editing factor PgeF n=1 Tax=Haliea sp. TaxID=1932666 RepID=UPI003527D43A
MVYRPGLITPDWPAPATVSALATTRLGGLSGKPWNTLNLGDHVGDEAATVAGNRQRLQACLAAGTRVQWLEQVHGAVVVPAQCAGEVPEADASWTHEAGVACAVLTADCLPVLFCDRGATVVAAAHAGWRGLAAGVLEATVRALPVAPEHVLAWLGPAIGPAAFEVGAEVRDAFLAGGTGPDSARAFLPAARSGHFYADIYQLARLRLQAAGVPAIYGGEFCTFNDSQRFYSYRRDGVTGRMATLIYLNRASDSA